MYLAMRTVIFFSLIFFFALGGYFSIFKNCNFPLFCENYEVREVLFGLSLIGLSSIALYNFRLREVLSTCIFCMLIIYMIVIFYVMRFNKEAAMTMYDLIPLIGMLSIFYFVIVSIRSKFK